MACIEPTRTLRQPAVIILMTLSTGILTDRMLSTYLNVLPQGAWLAFFGLQLLCLFRDFWLQQTETSHIKILVLCAMAGGALHHWHWHTRFKNDISVFAQPEFQVVKVEGILTRPPRVRSRQSNPALAGATKTERTQGVLRCTQLATETGWKTVSGNAWISVTGILQHAQIGDYVRVVGLLGLPGERVNPGGFDFRNYLRQQRCLSMIVIKHSAAVQVLHRPLSSALHRWIHRWRQQSESYFVAHLSPQAAELASALLLGSRSHMQEQTSRMFAQSGTMHLLAISGVHVGILAAFIWYGASLCFLPNRFRILAILMAMLFYCLVTEMRPSVVRASLFISLGFLAQCVYRQAFSINTLAVTAILILLLDSTQLFEIGAQLSFLATFGVLIALYGNLIIDKLFTQRSVLKRKRLIIVRDYVLRWLRATGLITIAIWILTAPLVAARFHLVAPVGYLMNLFLVPLLIPILFSGYLYLVLIWLMPGMTTNLQIGFDTLLQFLSCVVNFSGELTWGHFYVADIPHWWLIVYYLLLLCLFFQRFSYTPPSGCTSELLESNNPQSEPLQHLPVPLRLSVAGLICWVLFGLIMALLPVHRTSLRCTILAVGHGSAILLELPNGKTLLYDCGSLNNEFYTSRVIQSAIWQRGTHRLDCVILSHADIDHFNALPHLLQRVPIGTLLLSRHFLLNQEDSVVSLCRSLDYRNIPVRKIYRGCRVLADPNVQIRVLHPPAVNAKEQAGSALQTDNQNSIVLEIDYAGRTLLLTGDVEGAALRQLREEPLDKTSILLSPHHGSLGANTPELLEWTRAEYLIASCSRREQENILKSIFDGQAKVYTTARHGAITASITANGKLNVQPFTSD